MIDDRYSPERELVDILEQISDLYYTKINGEQMKFLENLHKKWNTPILN